MNKTVLATALALGMGIGTAQAAPVAWTGLFNMYNPGGGVVDANDGGAGTSAYVTGMIDTVAGTFSLSSTDPFFALNWSTSGGTLFGPGTYTVSTADPLPGVSGGNYTFTVGAGQLGGQIDFAWGGTTGIDVVMVWNVVSSGGNTTYTSTDWDSNGTPGAGMIDGPFPGFSANFNMTHPTVIPVPAAVWLLGSGLLGLVGIARRKKKA